MAVYPFVPKSALRLLPGQFWSVPLTDNQFACGLVLQPAARYVGASRMLFFGALLDWIGPELPSVEAISGAKVLAEGKIHIKSIGALGGQILGQRAFSADELSPGHYKHSLGDPHGWLMHGIEPERPLDDCDADAPVGSVWGYGYIKALADARLVKARRQDA